MPAPAQVGVVAVNWNTCRHILACLEAVGASPAIVVDNASSDGSAERVRREFPRVRLIANAKNLGYAAAVNQGIAALDTPYILVLNADVRCSPSTTQHLAHWLDAHPRTAVVGPRLTDPAGRLQLSWGRDPSPATEFAQRWWWRQLESQPSQSGLKRHAATPRRVDWVLGACLLIRREAFRAVGGLDEQYFMYFEEVDFCTRLRRAGWDIWYVPTVCAVHDGRASTSQAADAMAVAYRRSQLRYYRRFHGPMAERILMAYLWCKLGRHEAGRTLLTQLETHDADK